MNEHKRSHAAVATRSGPIDELFAAAARWPDLISFAAGAPDPALLPVESIAGLTAAALDRQGRAALQYGLTGGLPALQALSRELLSERGIDCAIGDIHIATGASGALHNICLATLDRGDVVLVETPTHGPAVTLFRSHGATVIGVDCDESGVLPDALDEAIRRHRPAFVYLMPTFHNPTGRTMPADRRARTAEVIRRHRTLVIEDDVYAELRYRGTEVPALASFVPGLCAYLTSLSKSVAPALRIGITVLPPALLRDVLVLKQGIDMQTSSFTQALAAEFLGGPTRAAHRRRLVEHYAAKLDRLAGALGEHLGPEFRWTVPDGGLFVWVEGPPGFDAGAVLPAALDHGVAFLPGSHFYADGGADHAHTLRLSFSAVPIEAIDRGVAALAEVCRL
ncbi:aminotransferase-like domain-containing protein [Nocardia aurantia]|uniref:2-aminoadipate transaminase n=1 Tax=Nocardia aurantia TaxID=2585199 RepID=A0A7K0DWG3_9NOCA|nr:PLP-dependent aminotransferase family protein [Nocardia aurantia]MQY30120.1 2-aminoadipate transaminase [Nocardia aurantia]